MRSPPVCNWKLHSSHFVDRARDLAHALEWSECQGPGGWSEARARVEARYGVPASVLKDLRHRPPKQLPAHVYARIEAAYRVMCQAQIDRFGELLSSGEGEDAAQLIEREGHAD